MSGKIGVISDTHGSVTAWQKALSGPLADVNMLVHAGDVLYHGPRNPLPEGYEPARLAELINSCPVPLLIARGNCDAEVDQMVLRWPLQTPYLVTVLEGLRVMVTHGHGCLPEEQAVLAKDYRIDLWISGHTHIPLLKRSGDCVFLNPGSPALPKQEENVPTVAVVENREVAVFSLETGHRIMGMPLKER